VAIIQNQYQEVSGAVSLYAGIRLVLSNYCQITIKAGTGVRKVVIAPLSYNWSNQIVIGRLTSVF